MRSWRETKSSLVSFSTTSKSIDDHSATTLHLCCLWNSPIRL